MGREDKHRRVNILRTEARILKANKRYVETVEVYNEAISLLRKIGTNGELVTCLMDRADCLYVISHLNKAVRDYDEALSYIKQSDLPADHFACLTNRALCHYELNKMEDALSGFDEAISLFRRYPVGDGFERCLMHRAHCLNTLERYEEALVGYDEAARLLRVAGQARALANCLRNQANCTYELGKKEEALASWNEAIPLFREHGPRSLLEECLVNRATCLSQLEHFGEAIVDADEVLPFLREQEPTADFSRCLMIRALCLSKVGSEQDAVAAYDQIETHYREHGPRNELADCLLNYADYLRTRGYYTKAISGFDEILRDFRAVLERDAFAQCLMQKGLCLVHLDRGEEALSFQDQALVIYREFGPNGKLAECLLNRAICLQHTGQVEQALLEYDKAIQLYLEDRNVVQLAKCLSEHASCLSDLGRWNDALAVYEIALEMHSKHGDPLNVAVCLANRSSCMRQTGDIDYAWQAALGLQEAQEIFQIHGTPADVAHCRVARAPFLVLLGRVEDALEEIKDVLPILREHGPPSAVAGSLVDQGVYLGTLGKHEDAVKSFELAVPILEVSGTAGDIAKCLMRKSSSLASLGDFSRALTGFDEAFVVEDRSSTMLQDPTHRVLAREQTTDYYRAAVRLASEPNQLDRAWGYVQRAKGRTLGDLLGARTEETALDRQERLLVQQREAGKVDEETFTTAMTRIGDQREVQRQSRFGRDARVPMALEDVVAALRPGEALLDAFRIDDDGTLRLFLLQHGQPAVCWSGPIAGAVLSSLVARWEEARQRWNEAVSATAKNAGFLSSSDPSIMARLDRLLILGDHEATMTEAAALEQAVLSELGDLVLAPVLKELDETVTTLIVSPDGLLHRLPLGAVIVSGADGSVQPLIDRFDLQLVPSSTSLAILRGKHGPRVTWPAALLAAAPFATGAQSGSRGLRRGSPASVASGLRGIRHRFRILRPSKHGMDEPVMQPRVSEGREEVTGALRALVRTSHDPGELRCSGPEIDAIAELLTAAGCPSPVTWTREATRSRLEEALPTAHILHLATHGGALESGESVMDYRIFLANNTEMRVRELYDGDVKLKDVYLANLSACSLGEVVLQGAEASGFVQAFLQAGAGVVLAPLWAVDDHATMLLMVKFYEVLTAPEPLTVARAWRRACHWLRTETKYSHPVYWAGFLPSGDASIRLTA